MLVSRCCPALNRTGLACVHCGTSAQPGAVRFALTHLAHVAGDAAPPLSHACAHGLLAEQLLEARLRRLRARQAGAPPSGGAEQRAVRDAEPVRQRVAHERRRRRGFALVIVVVGLQAGPGVVRG
jgi:hypothetical protein